MTLDKTKQTRGKWWYEYKWYSICSMHGFSGTQEECLACQSGHWVNTWEHKISGFIHKLFPKLWIWYNNSK